MAGDGCTVGKKQMADSQIHLERQCEAFAGVANAERHGPDDNIAGAQKEESV
jgi:hypothetical protein